MILVDVFAREAFTKKVKVPLEQDVSLALPLFFFPFCAFFFYPLLPFLHAQKLFASLTNPRLCLFLDRAFLYHLSSITAIGGKD
jgi:hypothetical protein